MLKHIQRISCRVNPYCGHEKQHSSRIQYVKRIFFMSAEYFQPLGALPHYHCTATTALQNWCGAVDFGESWHSISSDHCSEVVCKCALYVYWHFRLAYYLPLYCHYYGYCDRPKFLNTTFLFVAKNRHLEKKSIKSSNSISKGEFTSPTITSWSFDVAVLYTDVSASTCFLFPDNKRLLPFCSFVPNAKLPFCFFFKMAEWWENTQVWGSHNTFSVRTCTLLQMWQMNGVIEVRVKAGVCLTFLYTVCSAGSTSSSIWNRGGLVDDSFIGSGRAMILPSSPNHFFPWKKQFLKGYILNNSRIKSVQVTLLNNLACCLTLPPLFSGCGSPECSHWSGIQEASPLHKDPRPPENEASCFRAV